VLRGVDIVGTPLASLERILAAADDDAVFNGTCGAESGWVPVSAASPSLLVATIEVERQHKAQDKPPLLPSPRHDPKIPSPIPERRASHEGLLCAAVGLQRSFDSGLPPSLARSVAKSDKQDDDVVLKVLQDELARSTKRLTMEKAAPPYYVRLHGEGELTFEVRAMFGALAGRGEGGIASLSADVRVGDYSLDNTNFSDGGG
jgi:hypothetical protein